MEYQAIAYNEKVIDFALEGDVDLSEYFYGDYTVHIEGKDVIFVSKDQLQVVRVKNLAELEDLATILDGKEPIVYDEVTKEYLEKSDLDSGISLSNQEIGEFLDYSSITDLASDFEGLSPNQDYGVRSFDVIANINDTFEAEEINDNYVAVIDNVSAATNMFDIGSSETYTSASNFSSPLLSNVGTRTNNASIFAETEKDDIFDSDVLQANVVEDGDRTLTDGTGGTAIGTIETGEVDGAADQVFSVARAGVYGLFSVSARGSWAYTLSDPTSDEVNELAEGETLEETLTVLVDDGSGEADEVSINVTITGTNDAPTTDDADVSASVVEGGDPLIADGIGAARAVGTVTFDDVDTSDDLSYTLKVDGETSSTGTINGTYGTFTYNDITGDWDYILDDPSSNFGLLSLAEGETAQEVITIEASDGNGGVVSSTVTINVVGSGDATSSMAMADDTSYIYAGSGDDTVYFNLDGLLNPTKVDGGEGTDTLVLAGNSDDYSGILNETTQSLNILVTSETGNNTFIASNFENIIFEGDDASYAWNGAMWGGV